MRLIPITMTPLFLYSMLSDLGIPYCRSYLLNIHTSIDSWALKSTKSQEGRLSPLLFALFTNNVNSTLSHSKILCFADYIKRYCKIGSIENCNCLQNGFDRLVT